MVREKENDILPAFTFILSAEKLGKAIHMIKLLIQVLGKIKTTFENVQDFWNIQTIECNALFQLRSA